LKLDKHLDQELCRERWRRPRELKPEGDVDLSFGGVLSRALSAVARVETPHDGQTQKFAAGRDRWLRSRGLKSAFIKIRGREERKSRTLAAVRVG
jgi:hypothetical protein